MKIVCAWCGKDMGEKDGKGVEGVSHGLCNECLVKLMAEVKNKIGDDETVTNQEGTQHLYAD